MKLASFVHQGIRSYGIVKADGVINLGRRLGDRYSDLKSLLAANALNEAQQLSGEKTGSELRCAGISAGD